MTAFYPRKNGKGPALAIVALAAVLAACLAPWPVQAGRMIWSTVDTPSSQFNTIASPSEINFLAMSGDGRTFYASDTSRNRLYRSDDAGTSWLEIAGNLVSAGAVLPTWNIAIAPNNSSFIAAVTSTGNRPRQVFVSIDGGQSWNDTAFPAASDISALSISPLYGTYDIAAGTRSGGSGDIYIYKTGGSGGAWAAQGLAGDVLSICFPPSYRSDPSIAVLYSTIVGTYFNAGIHDLNANTTNWGSIYGGSPPEITAAGAGSSPTAGQVVSGCLQLTADYSGQAPAMCRAYLSVDAPGSNAGIFRLDNTVVYQLMSSQTNRRVSSIAYFGTYTSGKLLAGSVSGDAVRATVLTWFTDAPMTCPSTCWYQTEKPPTGAGVSGYGNAILIWAPDGSRTYCGTGSALLNIPASWPLGYLNSTPMDESAFSLSTDNGRTWNQFSLIDTDVGLLSDVVVSADSGTIYLASINNLGAGLDSIWLSNGEATGKSWQRVLCLPSASDDIILRMSNYGNDGAVFMASRGTADLRRSQDGGQTWKEQLPGLNVTDFSVTTINNTRYLYALSGTNVRRANASSLVPQWSQQVSTTLYAGHTIFAAPNGLVVVGGDSADNRVAIAPGNGPFTATAAFPSAGHIHAIVDFRFSDAALIYAASNAADSDVYYWFMGASRAWDIMGAPSSGFWGLAQMGTLYGAATVPGGSTVDRTLYPESLGPPVIEWDSLTTGLPAGAAFTREPVSLKLSAGVNLWAIDDNQYNYTAGTGRLWTFYDCLSPTPRYMLPPPSPSQKEFPPAATPPSTPKPPEAQPEALEPIPPVLPQNTQSPPAAPSAAPSAPALTNPADNGTLTMAPLFANDIYLWICATVAFLVIVLIIVIIATSVSRRRF